MAVQNKCRRFTSEVPKVFKSLFVKCQRMARFTCNWTQTKQPMVLSLLWLWRRCGEVNQKCQVIFPWSHTRKHDCPILSQISCVSWFWWDLVGRKFPFINSVCVCVCACVCGPFIHINTHMCGWKYGYKCYLCVCVHMHVFSWSFMRARVYMCVCVCVCFISLSICMCSHASCVFFF